MSVLQILSELVPFLQSRMYSFPDSRKMFCRPSTLCSLVGFILSFSVHKPLFIVSFIPCNLQSRVDTSCFTARLSLGIPSALHFILDARLSSMSPFSRFLTRACPEFLSFLYLLSEELNFLVLRWLPGSGPEPSDWTGDKFVLTYLVPGLVLLPPLSCAGSFGRPFFLVLSVLVGEYEGC